MGIKAKQVAGVTTLVVVVVVALSAYHVATLVRLNLEETASRGQMLAQAIFQRAKEVVAQGGADPYEALRTDGGIRSIIESSIGNWPRRHLRRHRQQGRDGGGAQLRVARRGKPLAKQENFARWSTARLVDADCAPSIRIEPSKSRCRCETERGDQEFGEIRIGVSTTARAQRVRKAVWGDARRRPRRPRRVVAGRDAALAVDAASDPRDPERAVAPRARRAGRHSSIWRSRNSATSGARSTRSARSCPRSVAARRSATGGVRQGRNRPRVGHGQPRGCGGAVFAPRRADFLQQVDERAAARERSTRCRPTARSGRSSNGRWPAGNRRGRSRSPGCDPADTAERLLDDARRSRTRAAGFSARCWSPATSAYLSQVQSTLNYSRKLAALGRLMAGVAHEVKNPLNAMTIHLELLKQKLARQPALPARRPGADRGHRPGLRPP